MIIGKIPPIRYSNRKLFCELKEKAKDLDISSDEYEPGTVPNLTKSSKYDPDAWIVCNFAFPHVDDSRSKHFFLTLSFKGDDFIFGDVNLCKKVGLGERVPSGTLFLVDPRITHWLYHRDWVTNKFWIGLQWDIPIKGWRKRVKAITSNLINFR